MDTLAAGQQLAVNDQLDAANGRTRVIMQGDGNLVLYRNDNGHALWASNTGGTPVNHVVMESRGLVAYDATGKDYWESNRLPGGVNILNIPNLYAILQDDANFVIYDPASRQAEWASNTVIDWNVVTVPQQRLDLGSGHYMVADAELNMASLVATFHLTETCTNKIAGFTGGVKLLYYDAQGKVLGDSGTLQYGIGQAPIIGANHRVETWNGQAPAGTIAVGLMIFADPHNRFTALEAIGNAIADGFKDLGTIIGDFASAAANFCSANPNICVGAVFVIAAGAILLSGGTLSIAAGGVEVVLAPAEA